MKSPFTLLVGILLLLIVSPLASPDATSATRAEEPFEILISREGNTLTLTALDGPGWVATCEFAPRDPEPIFVARGGVTRRLEETPGGYVFRVELEGGRVYLYGERGTTWESASFGCTGSLPCEFIVSETGVRGGLI